MFEIVSVTKQLQSTRIRTFAIITTDSNDLVAEIHDRMPVILAPPITPVGCERSRTRAT